MIATCCCAIFVERIVYFKSFRGNCLVAHPLFTHPLVAALSLSEDKGDIGRVCF